jgi:hypothetical protein
MPHAPCLTSRPTSHPTPHLRLGTQLSPTAAFTSDLGLDSLDAVEVVMAIEEEFGIEIPDAEADEITTVAQGEWGRLSSGRAVWVSSSVFVALPPIAGSCSSSARSSF